MKKLLRKLFLYLFKEDFQRMKALEREVRKVVGARSKSARTGREARLEKLIDGRNNVLYQSRDDNLLHGCATVWRIIHN